MTPAEILRKAADELEAWESTFNFVPSSVAHAIYDAVPGSLAGDDAAAQLAFKAVLAVGQEYRDEEVRRLRAAALRLETGGNPLLHTTSPGDVGKFRR